MLKIKGIRIFFLLSAIFVILFIISGCSLSVNVKSQEVGKIKITASLFPQYDFAKQIARDKADVTLILPPGTESHTFDPTPTDIMKISNSDIFLYTGENMEPWASRIISGAKSTKLNIVDVSSGIELLKNKSGHSCSHHECSGNHEHNYDPHIWLDPTIALKMVDNIKDALCNKDPKNKEFYINNANIYKEKLKKLDSDIMNYINNASCKSIVFAGRFAHLYFINRYGLNYKAAFKGCSSEAEPSVKSISKIISFIKDNGIKAIYYEEFTEPKIAKSIAEQTGVKTLKFSTLHNVSKEQLESEVTYIDIMYENLKNLKQGLN